MWLFFTFSLPLLFLDLNKELPENLSEDVLICMTVTVLLFTHFTDTALWQLFSCVAACEGVIHAQIAVEMSGITNGSLCCYSLYTSTMRCERCFTA